MSRPAWAFGWRQARRSAWLALPLLLASVAVAQEQAPEPEPTPPGSVTLVSRPLGVAVRISGDREITGRTPFTLERGLAGRYLVRTVEPGYETWRRAINLDGTSEDTLWMTLRPKTAFKAGLRSVVLPGWGQLYSDRPVAGVAYLAIGVAAGGALVWTHLEYEGRVDDLQEAITNAERRRAAERAEKAYDDRQIALAVAGGVWAVNVLDAMVFMPRRANRAVTLRLSGALHGDSGVALVVRGAF